MPLHVTYGRLCAAPVRRVQLVRGTLDELDDVRGLERRVLGGVEYYHDLTVTHTDDKYMASHNEVDGRAIYFIRTHEAAPECLEMGFELTAYQPALRARREAGVAPKIYQTIYLDRQRSDLWTIDQIATDKIIDRAWWSAFSHTYVHFRKVVPWGWTIQGTKHTWYAGSWTLFNTHDIAISSGLAAAHRARGLAAGGPLVVEMLTQADLAR